MPLLPTPIPFKPLRGLGNAHVQTVLAHFLPSEAPILDWERLNLKLPDGDVLTLRVARGTRPAVAYLFHGLAGSTESGYMKRLAGHLGRRGFSVVAVNHRGAGEGRGMAARPYHAGIIGDLSAVFAMGRTLFPESAHVGLGFSLSANALLLMLGSGDHHLALPDAAVAVSPPANLEACSHRLGRGFNRLYQRRFVRDLLEEVRVRWELGLIDPVPFPHNPSLRDFDACYTAPQSGFWDREHYYARVSCGPHLRRTSIPTVVIASEDDPFAPASDVQAHPLAENLHLHLTRQGGHMGFLAQHPTPLGDRRWMDYAVIHYVEALLEQGQAMPHTRN